MKHQSVILILLVLLAGSIKPSGTEAAPRLPDIPNPKVVDSPEIGRYGGTLAATGADPRTLNPLIATESSSLVVLAPIFDTLIEENYLTGELEPGLAESWRVSADKREWFFTLREGVTWSDGRPFTADDVIFTLRAIFTDGVASIGASLLSFGGKRVRYRKLDARRVWFATDRPVGFFLRLLASENIPIVPQHKLSEVLAKGGEAFNAAWGINTPPSEIVGTGPFVLASLRQAERVTYLRNSRYWKVDRAGNRLPYLTRVVRIHIPNFDVARLKFLAGEIDLFSPRPREFAELQQGQQAGKYTIYDGPETLASEFVAFNQNPSGVPPPKLTWFSDVRFRRALNHAIDRPAIIQQVYGGRATAAWSPVSIANTLYYAQGLIRYPFDLDRTQQLLAEAGYRKGSDGLLRDPGGNVVEFTLTTNASNLDRVSIGTILRQDWEKLGIRVTFAPEDFNTLVGRLSGTYKWEAVIIGLTGSIEPGIERDVWLSSGTLHLWHPKQGIAATGWEADIDRLFEEIAVEIDEKRRKVLYARWQQIVASQVPLMFIAHRKAQVAVRNTLGNVKLGYAGGIGRLSTLYYKAAYR